MNIILPNGVQNEVGNQLDKDDYDKVEGKDEESEISKSFDKQVSPFEVASSENKVGFTFSNTGLINCFTTPVKR